jgi:hypothetical protein
MKTFACSLLSAYTLATDLPVDKTELDFKLKSVPDFVAGLVSYLAKQNDLEEVQKCLTSTDVMYK